MSTAMLRKKSFKYSHNIQISKYKYSKINNKNGVAEC